MAAGETQRFPRKAIDLVDASAREGRLLLAAISLWEVAMLEAKGRIRLDFSCTEWLKQTQRKTAILVAPLEAEIAALSAGLPEFHGDPADRIIVATAIHHGATLITADERILAYARKGGYRTVRLK